jgi:hypothetical protein
MKKVLLYWMIVTATLMAGQNHIPTLNFYTLAAGANHVPAPASLNPGTILWITDAQTASDCSSAGGGTLLAMCYVTNLHTLASFGGGGSMTWPTTPGITVCTGTPCTNWGASLAAPASALVGLSDIQSLTNKTLDGVTPTVMGYVDPTSSIQTQLNGKQSSLSFIPPLNNAAGAISLQNTTPANITSATGNGTKLVTSTGAQASGAIVAIDASGNHTANAQFDDDITLASWLTYSDSGGIQANGFKFIGATPAVGHYLRSNGAKFVDNTIQTADVFANFTGCSGTMYPGFDGTCHSSSGGTPSFPVTVAGTVNSGGVPYFSNATTESSSAALASGEVVTGGGAGAAPSTTGVQLSSLAPKASPTFTGTPTFPALPFVGTSLTGGAVWCNTSATNITQSGVLAVSRLLLGGGATACPSFASFSAPGLVMQLNAGSQAATYAGGFDGAANQSGGNGIFRGGGVTSGSTTGWSSGNATLQGGDNQATGATETGGDAIVRPGTAQAAATTANNGRLVLANVGIKGATYTPGNLQCIVATAPTDAYPPTYGDCASTTLNLNWVGVALTAVGNTAIVQWGGDVLVNSKNATDQWTTGWTACIDGSNAALVVAVSTTACTGGNGVGIVSRTDGSQRTTHYIVLHPR